MCVAQEEDRRQQEEWARQREEKRRAAAAASDGIIAASSAAPAKSTYTVDEVSGCRAVAVHSATLTLTRALRSWSA